MNLIPVLIISLQWYSEGMCEKSRVITYANTTERWLWTQYIQKSVPAPDEYPVRVFVNVTVSPSTTSSINDSLELQIQHADRNESQIQYIDKNNPVQFYFEGSKNISIKC